MAGKWYQDKDLWSGVGGMGTGLMGLFGGGGTNPADAAMPYLDKIPGATGKYFDPYINAGKNALPTLEEQYQQLLNGPGGKLNTIGKDYQQSPGFQFALQQALQGGNQAAAAGGMAGSPMHEQANMATATGLANQDYNQWLEKALGLYGRGLTGEEGTANRGLNASTSQADQVAQALAAQAKLKYEGQAQQNQRQGSGIGDFISGAAKVLPFIL